MTCEYEIVLHWSRADGVFVAEVRELAGCVARGDARQTDIRTIEEAMALGPDTAAEFGDPIPEPEGERPRLA